MNSRCIWIYSWGELPIIKPTLSTTNIYMDYNYMKIGRLPTSQSHQQVINVKKKKITKKLKGPANPMNPNKSKEIETQHP